MQEALIQLEDVGKSYPLVQQGGGQLAHVWARLRGKEPAKVYHALQGISFDVMPGQSMGLVGVNGAGKSTLLKLIAGVVKPTTGTLIRRGRVGALLELGAGFQPEYTGRENVFLASALMGLSRQQTQEKLDDILAFADIGDHIDQPIKHYSSGMVVRLGFAVATSVMPDVLITDEVLAVGDESFQKKCIQWMERYLSNGGTLLLCSHSMYHIQKLCQRAIWIDEGRMRMLGEAHEVTRHYLAWHEEKSRVQTAALDKGKALANATAIYHVRQVRLNGVALEDSGHTTLALSEGANLSVSGKLFSPDGRAPHVAVGLVRADGTSVYGVVSEMDGHVLQQDAEGLFGFELRFDNLPLLPGRYAVRVHALDPEGLRLFDQHEGLLEIKGSSRELGFCRLAHHWA